MSLTPFEIAWHIESLTHSVEIINTSYVQELFSRLDITYFLISFLFNYTERKVLIFENVITYIDKKRLAAAAS